MQQASEYCCQGRAHSLGSHQVRESLLPRVHTDRVAEIDEGGRYHRREEPPASARAAISTARFGANDERIPANAAPKSVRRNTRTRPSLSESIPIRAASSRRAGSRGWPSPQLR